MLELYDGVDDGQWSGRSPALRDTADDLVSTGDDYLAFGVMLLAGGQHGTERILSRPSIALMTADHITPAQKAVSEFFPRFWDATTPSEDLVGILMTQRLASEESGRLYEDFWTSVYQAIDD